MNRLDKLLLANNCNYNEINAVEMPDVIIEYPIRIRQTSDASSSEELVGKCAQNGDQYIQCTILHKTDKKVSFRGVYY